MDGQGVSAKSFRRSALHPDGVNNSDQNEWPKSPLHVERDKILDEMSWSMDGASNSGKNRNHARAYEFRWSDMPGKQQCNVCDFGNIDEIVSDASSETQITEWLTETRLEEAVSIRIFICQLFEDERTGEYGLSLSRKTFQAVEKDFGLHPATWLALRSNQFGSLALSYNGYAEHSSWGDDGVFVLAWIMPALKGESFLISMKHSHLRKRTDAVLFAKEYIGKEVDFSSIGQLIHNLQCLPQAWKHFRLLPDICLQLWVEKARTMINFSRQILTEVERDLGASRRWEGECLTSLNWPQNVEVKRNTAKLHKGLYHFAVDRLSIRAARHLHHLLAGLESQLADTNEAAYTISQCCKNAGGLESYGACTNTLLQNIGSEMECMGERAQVQADLLFSIISQKDNHDNISMAQSAFVFTFITALFLPCTFVASLFSMSMFNWPTDSESDSTNTSYVSGKFWIYWATSLPLTILVMGGWYWWSMKGMKMWNRSDSAANEDATGWRAKSRWVRFLGRAPQPTQHVEAVQSIGSGHSQESLRS